MPEGLGYSVYLSTFEQQRQWLEDSPGKNAPVFLSLHMGEEFDDTYCARAERVCRFLTERGYRVMADVSRKTLQQFHCQELEEIVHRLGLWAVRFDYGFSREAILEIARRMPVVLNASTISPEEAQLIGTEGREVYAMHNFYPRPETGLDRDYLMETTRLLHEAGLKVMAFIPGDTLLRGPVFEGLPTLEDHRKGLPSAAFVDLASRYGMDEIFLGDPGISDGERGRINRFCEEGVISIPAVLQEDYEHLYDRVFTCRADSPQRLIRFRESRTYACAGGSIPPRDCAERLRGSITIDNENYGRYSSELQLVREYLPADPRVNVIGSVSERGMMLAECVGRGQQFVLVRP